MRGFELTSDMLTTNYNSVFVKVGYLFDIFFLLS